MSRPDAVTDRNATDHYAVLGVSRAADAATIRQAYRQAAFDAHPDRHGPGSAARMAAVNEAWRVLGEPQARRRYDDELAAREGTARGSAAGPSSSRASTAPPAMPTATVVPGRFPWRFLGVMALLGIGAVLIGAALTKPTAPGAPDGILRAGDCVRLDDRALEAAEVPCSGPHDAVVDSLIPFDQQCPSDTRPYRDRQGMGTACVVPLAPGRD